MSSRSYNDALRRLPFLLPGILALVVGLWGGLLRVPLNVPLPVEHANWISHHGALMICGFLGTLIGIERAVGSSQRWAWGAPILTGLGALLCLGGLGTTLVFSLFLCGSAIFGMVTLHIAFRYREFFTALMAVAALAWVFGNILLLADVAIGQVVWWWAAFLGWTIIAERLELTRLLKLPSYARPLLVVLLSVQLVGLLLLLWSSTWGTRIVGIALLGQAFWLLRFDLARKNILLTGLPKFTAVCLLLGYGWLSLSGVMLTGLSPLMHGSSYDAVLHAFFLGFVFAMIFGHAPIIFPAVLKVPIVFANRFYLHIILLQVTLVVRVVAGLTGAVELRGLAVAGNVLVIGIFLLNTVASVITGMSPSWSGKRS